MTKKLTPMMQQYTSVKKRYPDSLVFFRLGDFYELFFEDAITASKELEITLTKRDCGNGEKAPMCGVPHHVHETYLARLVKKGYKVAICEQLEDPKTAKGVVKRDVVRLVTPGTLTDPETIAEPQNNFIASLYIERKEIGLTYADLTTGEIYAESHAIQNRYDRAFLTDALVKISPAELLLNRSDLFADQIAQITRKRNVYLNVIGERFDFHDPKKIIYEKLPNVKLPQSISPALLKSIGQLLENIYAFSDEPSAHMNRIIFMNAERTMGMDANTRINLELTQHAGKKKGSLLSVIDQTRTSMGARMLHRWVEQPLREQKLINARLDVVEALLKDYKTRSTICSLLDRIYDIERLIGKFAYSKANGRDALGLKESIAPIPQLIDSLKGSENQVLMNKSAIDPLKDVYDLLEASIVDEPPILITEGNLIKAGYNSELDALKSGSIRGKKLLIEYEAQERERTGIKNLRIIYNKNTGYAIEITRAQTDKAPIEYVRKQTLKNAERYTSEELNTISNQILGNEQESMDMEYALFQEIRSFIVHHIERLQKVSRQIAEIDALTGLAETAVEKEYVRPTFNSKGSIQIKKGRHPVVEVSLAQGEFIDNDTSIDMGRKPIHIITGPNMAGKSTYMRQIALIQILGQIGSFVPAESAQLALIDQIFTRIGASDDLASGDSTFMVEMKEVANILNHASMDSLILLDEVGRGTSTNDGLAIAWSLVEHLSSSLPAKTLFATHYHELTKLSRILSNVMNMKVDIEESGDHLVFLRKIVPGQADRSYGIEVARMAGFPERILTRAQQLLEVLEARDVATKDVEILPPQNTDLIETIQALESRLASQSQIIKQLEEIDMNLMSPMESFSFLNELVREVKIDH